MKNLISLILLSSLNLFADTVSFKNQIRFFEKENFSAIVTTQLCPFTALDIEIQIPENSQVIQKVYQKKISCNEFDGTVQIYFHQRGPDKYFSQQVYVATQEGTLAFCTSYFPLDAKFLVPGACIGNLNKKAIGISLFK